MMTFRAVDSRHNRAQAPLIDAPLIDVDSADRANGWPGPVLSRWRAAPTAPGWRVGVRGARRDAAKATAVAGHSETDALHPVTPSAGAGPRASTQSD
jgi:hypothetical protein